MVSPTFNGPGMFFEEVDWSLVWKMGRLAGLAEERVLSLGQVFTGGSWCWLRKFERVEKVRSGLTKVLLVIDRLMSIAILRLQSGER